MKPQNFIEKIFQDIGPDEFICVSEGVPKRDADGMWFNNMFTSARLWQRWTPETDPRAMYFSVCTTNGEENDKGRAVRGRSALIQPCVLVLDDIGDKTGEPPVEPTYKMETSPGSFQWGYCLWGAGPADLGTFEALCSAIHLLGYGDAGAGGSYRVVRVPGSANLKPGRGGFLSHLSYEDWASVWTLEDLAEDFGLDLDALPVADTSAPGVRDASGGAVAIEGIDPLLAWLSDAGSVVNDDGGDWVDVLCPWADQHTNGSNTAGYSPLGRGDGGWQQRRAFKCLHEHCAGHKFKDARDHWHDAGAPYCAGFDPVPWYQARYVLVGTGQKVADMHLRANTRSADWVMDFKDFKYLHPDTMPVEGSKTPAPVVEVWRKHEKTTRALAFTYEPVLNERDDGLVGKDPVLVNTYRPVQWTETGIEPAVFLEHIEYLLPVAAERELFLDWLAYKIQKPRSRSYAVCMVAETFGIGRSYVKDMLEVMLPGAVGAATLAQLTGSGGAGVQTYNDWQVGCQFLVVEEAKDMLNKDVFYRGYEEFKQNVDTRTRSVRINPKFGRTAMGTVFYNALIFSNHTDALVIPEGDRRLAVFRNPDDIKDPAYYEALNKTLDDGREAGRLYWFLRRRDVSAYDPIYPPMTEAKAEMIEETLPPSGVVYNYLVQQWPSDLILRSELPSIIHRALAACDIETSDKGKRVTEKEVWKRLMKLGADHNGKRVSVDGKQVEVRALRVERENKKYLMGLSKDDVLAEIAKSNTKNLSVLLPPSRD